MGFVKQLPYHRIGLHTKHASLWKNGMLSLNRAYMLSLHLDKISGVEVYYDEGCGEVGLVFLNGRADNSFAHRLNIHPTQEKATSAGINLASLIREHDIKVPQRVLSARTVESESGEMLVFKIKY